MPKELTSQQVGTQRRAHATEPKTRVTTGLTQFPMSYKMPNTARYGHITPFYYQHSRGDDTVPLFSEHDLRTYTLQSPMLSDVNMNKTYFQIDMEAIYPRNWNLMIVNPSKGDDVPEDTRAVVRTLISTSASLLNYLKSLSDDSLSLDNIFTFYVRSVLFLESIYSNGSLFSEFNIHLTDFFRGKDDYYDTEYYSFDTWFDTKFIPSIKDKLVVFFDGESMPYRVSDNNNYYSSSVDNSPSLYVPLRYLLDRMRVNSFTISIIPVLEDFSAIDYLFFTPFDNFGTVYDTSDYPINLEVIFGYQLGCAQFFTDSHVDYIYNASLYRDALENKLGRFFTNVDDLPNLMIFTSFEYNGTIRYYDVFSGANFDGVLSVLQYYLSDESLLPFDWSYLKDIFDIFSFVFSHQHSLKYGDYFVTGRPNPLGIGDVNVDTSGDSVSVIDITRNIQYQRFLNSVNIARQDIGDYARKVLGLVDAGDIGYDIPQFIAHKSLPIRGMEVENTGDRQLEANSVTTLLRSSNNTHAFEVRTKRPSIIYGVYSFDVARIYSKTFDRMHMHENRFDDFIPQMQYIGDQPIYKRELNATTDPDGVFAYSLRYMEYKIRNNYAAGGAVEKLPSWFFITDGIDGSIRQSNISPDYIRSNPSEFDKFYSSLTGYSLGTYFHFIVMTTNHQTLTRKMDYAPEPLK